MMHYTARQNGVQKEMWVFSMASYIACKAYATNMMPVCP